jgi:uncharacterized membrane protein
MTSSLSSRNNQLVPDSIRQSKLPFSPLWRLLVLICLIAGLVFRFVNFQQVFWYDEAFTTLRISGYSEAEAVQSLTAKQLVTPAEFEQYRQINPNESLITSLTDSVKGLATEEPQHTPLYYVLVRIWAGIFGDALSTVRAFSAVLSLLALPCMAWLCYELYGTVGWLGAGWAGAALLAVSPFQVIYAQEARPIALWIVAILLSSAALLRALRLNTRRSWLIYGITLTLSLYTYLFSGLVAIAHAIYVLVRQRGRWTPVSQNFVIAGAISFLAFLPWLIALANPGQVNTVTDWLTDTVPLTLIDRLKLWGYQSSLSFVDRGSVALPSVVLLVFKLFQVVVRISVLYALYLIWRQTPLRSWSFVISLTVIPALILTLPDLLDGGKRSTIPRYIVPVYLGLELAMAYLATRALTPPPIAPPVSPNPTAPAAVAPISVASAKSATSAAIRPRQRLWQLITLIVLLAGLASSSLISASPRWWNKVHAPFPEIAAQINLTARPLVISTAELGDLMALSYYLDPKVALWVKPTCFSCNLNLEQRERFELPAISPGYSDVFLFNPRPADAWLNQLNQQPQIETLSQVKGDWFTEYWLWKLKSPVN